MVFKSIVMLTIFFVPLLFLNMGFAPNVWSVFLLYIISGLGMAGIGMGIMHDALHGTYSKNRKVNKIMGLTMNLIGANAEVWKIQHNVLHHTYTNITEADDDINAPFFLRFSPHAKKYWIHRFQFLYAWFFYGLSTLSWVVSKDYIRLNRYKKLGFFKTRAEYHRVILWMILWKLIYFTYALILPMIFLPFAPWIIVLGFIVKHFVTGFLITIVFQTAHVMPETDFPMPDEEGQMENGWLAHQLATTTNFAPKSRFFSWLIGGLNYQVEHHLMPNICHVHYRKLSKIVAETAREYGLPYKVKPNFVAAVVDHFKMLYRLGRAELVPAKAPVK